MVKGLLTFETGKNSSRRRLRNNWIEQKERNSNKEKMCFTLLSTSLLRRYKEFFEDFLDRIIIKLISLNKRNDDRDGVIWISDRIN